MQAKKRVWILGAMLLCAGATVGQTGDMQSGTAPTPQLRPPIARISGGVMAGNILTKVAPVYPPDAKAQGISGTVVLHAIIGKDGKVQFLQAVSGPENLAKAAIDAVRQWTYKPYLLNGNPVEVDTVININFNLAGSAAPPPPANTGTQTQTYQLPDGTTQTIKIPPPTQSASPQN